MSDAIPLAPNSDSPAARAMFRRLSEISHYLTCSERCTDPTERAYYAERREAWIAEREDLTVRLNPIAWGLS